MKPVIRPHTLLLVALAAGCTPAPAPAPPSPLASSSPPSAPPPAAPAAPSAATPPTLDASVDTADSSIPTDRQGWARWCDKPDHVCVVYVPTPQKVVDKMLDVARVHRGDVIYDLGCGDGRILITAAKRYGVKGLGVDIDPERVKEAQDGARKTGVADLVTIQRADVFTVDLSPASVVFMYLLPEMNVKLVPQLAKVAPGTRIVSHDFDIEGTVNDGHWTLKASFFGRENELFDAAVPEDPAHYKQVDHEVFTWVAPLRWKPDAGR